MNGEAKIGLDEVEEGLEVGITAMFGLLFSAFCDFAQERQDFVGCDGGKIPVFPEVITELGERNAVGLNRIFFPNSSCGTLDRLELPVRVSCRVSFCGCRWVKTDGHYDRNVSYPSQPCKNSGWCCPSNYSD